MASTKRHTINAAVYLLPTRDDEVLLLRRFNTGWMDGHYSLIAGHLDGNESVSAAMIREAKEEARITVKPEDLQPVTVLHRKSDREYVDFFFVTTKWEGDPVIGEPDKCDDLSWFPLNKLPDNLLPYVREAMKNYKKKISFSESGW